MASGHSNISNDLQWLLIKHHTSFLRTRGQTKTTFSAEKGNLRNIHSFTYSGLCNERTLDISPSSSAHGVTLTSRTKAASPRSVAKGLEARNVKGKGGRKVAGAVMRQCASETGRLDLRKHALARASAILASQAATHKAQSVRALRGKHAIVA